MSQSAYRSYAIQSQLHGWTRIDMLIAIYDRAISSIQSLAQEQSLQSSAPFQGKFLEAQKCLLAIHAGINPAENEIGYNIARLIHFVSNELSSHRFGNAASILESIRNGFDAIREEATRLELEGKIPSLEHSQSLNTVA
jgi:flagellar secretion chaperone FliS